MRAFFQGATAGLCAFLLTSLVGGSLQARP
jgi:hypothetical protein